MIYELDELVITEYKKIINITAYNMDSISSRYDIAKHVNDLLKALKDMPFSGFCPFDYAIEHTMENLLQYDEEFKNIKLNDDMKENWVIREAHNTFDYDEWENHIKRAIYHTLEYYEEPEY